MTRIIPLCAAGMACIIALILQRRKKSSDMCISLMTFALPFAAGGFHGYTTAFCGIFISVCLIRLAQKQRNLTIYLNLSFVAVFTVFFASCVTPFWAADKGMALFGVLRWIPVLLYTVYLMQFRTQEREKALELVSLSGAMMTLSAILLLAIPGMEEYVAVNGRLSGFFQYPNTYAAYLLVGFVLYGFQDREGKWGRAIPVILLSGIVLSGSRTVFVLMAIALVVLFLKRKGKIELILSVFIALIIGIIATRSGFLFNADRYMSISTNSGTFLVRLLYYKDAIRPILQNPLGLGYLGYQALEGSIQTGRYWVTFVHNGFLQLLLDFGWFPALIMAAVLVTTLFSKRISVPNRLALALLLGHCMADYDTEFLAIWIIILTILHLENGKKIVIGCNCITVVSALLSLLCLWMGAGELLYYTENTDSCLKVTPFHTNAMIYTLSQTDNPEDQSILADEILEKNHYSSIAWTAKANEAFRRADMEECVRFQEKAILCDKYNIRRYCDYIDKLYVALQIYQREGNVEAETYCRNKMMTVHDLMQQVHESTDSMILPEQYQQLLQAISK